jgi:hypothetical protein
VSAAHVPRELHADRAGFVVIAIGVSWQRPARAACSSENLPGAAVHHVTLTHVHRPWWPVELRRGVTADLVWPIASSYSIASSR